MTEAHNVDTMVTKIAHKREFFSVYLLASITSSPNMSNPTTAAVASSR